MSDNIPFDIQMEIIKKVSDFRSVSKPWKSFIESSEFIHWYGARNTQPHSFLLRYKVPYVVDNVKYVRLVEDDNNETFKVHEQEFAPSVVSPLIKHFSAYSFVGACHGLVCLYGYMNNMLVVWNPSTGNSFGIADPNHLNSRFDHMYGFGVCPDTSDPTVVKIIQKKNKPWLVEVFTLSSGVWNVIPCSNLPSQSIEFESSTHVVIDRFIYWVVYEKNVGHHDKYMLLSFDLITKEFKLVHLPDSLTYGQHERLSLSKLRESLVVYRSFGVWVMQHDSSFKKLFSIHKWVDKILGFRESGEPICEIRHKEDSLFKTLVVYDLCSHQINDLGIYGEQYTFDMGSYKESLLLLNHSDSRIYCDSSDQIDDDIN